MIYHYHILFSKPDISIGFKIQCGSNKKINYSVTRCYGGFTMYHNHNVDFINKQFTPSMIIKSYLVTLGYTKSILFFLAAKCGTTVCEYKNAIGMPLVVVSAGHLGSRLNVIELWAWHLTDYQIGTAVNEFVSEIYTVNLREMYLVWLRWARGRLFPIWLQSKRKYFELLYSSVTPGCFGTTAKWHERVESLLTTLLGSLYNVLMDFSSHIAIDTSALAKSEEGSTSFTLKAHNMQTLYVGIKESKQRQI